MSNKLDHYIDSKNNVVPIDVTFFEDEHLYTYNPTGENYTSCTTVIGKFKPEFDTISQAKRYAARNGFDYQDVIDEWDTTKQNACNFGTEIHLFMEDMINADLHMPPDLSKYRNYTDQSINFNNLRKSFQWIIENVYRKNVGVEIIIPEGLLWNSEYKIAGMSDVIINHPNNKFSILDFKTNKKYRYWNDFNESMLEPLEYMPVCEHTTYSLQLSIYALLYSLITGRELHSITILYLDRELSIWKPIYCAYMKHQVLDILENFKNKNENKNENKNKNE